MLTATRLGSVVAAFICAALTLAPTAGARAGEHVVHYRGYAVTVPAGWPVFRLADHPTACVRFNRHAVYLGAPGAAQHCPAVAIGRTDAILVEPRHAASASLSPADAPGPSTLELPVASRGVEVIATWKDGRTAVARALGLSSGAFSRAAAAPAPARPAATMRPMLAARAKATAASATYTGLGFDACSAPSTTAMADWAASPFRAIGVYIGGANSACAQPNLTASWVAQQSVAGWHLIPTYVGLQARSNSCGCQAISRRRASSQGSAAALDAISRAGAIGIGRGNPIYYDMEAYAHTAANTSAVLSFLSAWTARLHAEGYKSGVYSSTGSGVTDLVNSNGTGYLEPDELWFAEWNGVSDTASGYVPAADWAGSHRVHQFAGGHDATYGGFKINIDSNYVDAATATAGSTGATTTAQRPQPFADGTFVEVTGTGEIYRIAGGAPLFVRYWQDVPGFQAPTAITQRQLGSLARVPADGTGIQTTGIGPTGTVVSQYRVAGGYPFALTNPALAPSSAPPVPVDVWDLTNLTNPVTHLRAKPANGTVVQGEPSRLYWIFESGKRTLSTTVPAATKIEDTSLAALPALPCLVPRLHGLTLNQARAVLRASDCALGKVTRHRSRHRRGAAGWRVSGQSASARSRRAALLAINLRLS